jgi:hypothetical protein
VQDPTLRFLHADESLSKVKLAQMERMTTEHLKQTLMPGQKDCLKARPDGTVSKPDRMGQSWMATIEFMFCERVASK